MSHDLNVLLRKLSLCERVILALLTMETPSFSLIEKRLSHLEDLAILLPDEQIDLINHWDVKVVTLWTQYALFWGESLHKQMSTKGAFIASSDYYSSEASVQNGDSSNTSIKSDSSDSAVSWSFICLSHVKQSLALMDRVAEYDIDALNQLLSVLAKAFSLVKQFRNDDNLYSHLFDSIFAKLCTPLQAKYLQQLDGMEHELQSEKLISLNKFLLKEITAYHAQFGTEPIENVNAYIEY